MLNAQYLPSIVGQAPDYEFVAAPDFLNQDVGDLRTLPSWHRGDPNSWTPKLQQGISRFLDEIEALDPDSVLVPGDLVEGHWGRDADHTGIFGPVRTDSEKKQAIRRAANFYYSTYKHRFDVRGLTLHAALGDHDIGDNDWDNRSRATRFKRSQIGLFKEMFARYFTRTPSGKPRYADRPVGTIWANTAYAVHLTPDVLLVSLDEFNRRDGDVHLEVQGGQLRWLRQTLKQARADGVPWVIVQGHNPILMPVRERSTSGGHIEGGRRSALWRTMARFGVDVYLNGEVHDTTMRQADGITQISAGGLLYTGNASYLVAKIYDDRIEFDARRIAGDRGLGPDLWQTTGPRTRARPEFGDAPSISIGSMTLTADGRAVNQVGQLQAYDVP
jgi:3',5'-cyclic AMP phosphodiesterase CpdA